MSRRVIQGYTRMKQFDGKDWAKNLEDISNPQSAIKRLHAKSPRSYFERSYRQIIDNILKGKIHPKNPIDVYHAVIIATYNESLEVLEPTVQSVLGSNYDTKRIILYIAYEERGGRETEENARYLVNKYGDRFMHATSIKHPDGIPGEVIGKGGNITYAGRQLKDWVRSQKIDYNNVIVTTLDSDNRPGPNYFSYLTFMYCITSERKYKSYQPVPMFFNNIWDAPAPMRVIATGNSFWMMIQSVRPHLLRNFSAHAQSLQALVETDFWSVRTVVEDGHQYWRTYFRYDGKHDTIPLYTPVYQDAVLAHGYLKTFKAQFIQLRRWAWGASDLAYVAKQSIRDKKIAWYRKASKFLRLYEGHFSWATAPLVLAFAGWLPLILNPASDRSILDHQLPIIASRIQTLAAIGILVTVALSILALPPRPKRYKPRRNILMVTQWFLIPITGIFFSSAAALNAQTRLMLGKYLGQFDVTEKAVKSDK